MKTKLRFFIFLGFLFSSFIYGEEKVTLFSMSEIYKLCEFKSPDKSESIRYYRDKFSITVDETIKSDKSFLIWMGRKVGVPIRKMEERLKNISKDETKIYTEYSNKNRFCVSRIVLNASVDVVCVYLFSEEEDKDLEIVLRTAFLIPHQTTNIGGDLANSGLWGSILLSPTSKMNQLVSPQTAPNSPPPTSPTQPLANPPPPANE